MKTVILYSAFQKLTKAHQPVRVFVTPAGKLLKRCVATLWIRAEFFDDIDQALNAPIPEEGETVLNMIPLPNPLTILPAVEAIDDHTW